MGDRAPASFTLYLTAGKERKILRLLTEYYFCDSTTWQEITRASIVDGASFTSDEAPLDILSELGREFEALGVAYYGHQDAKYEYDGEVRLFTPALGVGVFFGGQDGSIFVRAEVLSTITDQLSEVVQACGEGATPGTVGFVKIVEDLNKLTGRAWTDALTKLRPELSLSDGAKKTRRSTLREDS
jgi:hypothetical protein